MARRLKLNRFLPSFSPPLLATTTISLASNMNHVHSSSLPTPTKPPEFRPPWTYMAVALIPTLLFHLVWMNALFPPYDFLLFIFTILLCFPLDCFAIRYICKPFLWSEESSYWWFAFCCQFPYVLISADFLLYRWMDSEHVKVPRKFKIPIIVLMICLSFCTFLAGIACKSQLRRREEGEESSLNPQRRLRTVSFELWLIRFSPLLLIAVMCHLNWKRDLEGRRAAWMAEGDEAIRLRVEAGREARERAKKEEPEDEDEEDPRIYMYVRRLPSHLLLPPTPPH